MTEEQALTLKKDLALLDSQLLELINLRAKKTGLLKRWGKTYGANPFGASNKTDAHNLIREKNTGPLKNELVDKLFIELASACQNNEPTGIIAVCGDQSSFTYQAAIKHFGSSAQYRPQASICEVFRLVERNQALFGVVPIENSTTGAYHATLDRMIESDLMITGEILMPISFELMAFTNDIKKIKTIVAKPQTFELCQKWLKANLAQIELKKAQNISEAIKKAQANEGTAFIASPKAAQIYKMETLAKDIQDSNLNQTRCLIISKAQLPETGNDKTSILFVTSHQPGSLLNALQTMADHGINLTRIESRPIKDKPWGFYFFADFEGHKDQKSVKEALRSLKKSLSYLKIFGSYAKAG